MSSKLLPLSFQEMGLGKNVNGHRDLVGGNGRNSSLMEQGI